jgi:hypothetical protein
MATATEHSPWVLPVLCVNGVVPEQRHIVIAQEAGGAEPLPGFCCSELCLLPTTLERSCVSGTLMTVSVGC